MSIMVNYLNLDKLQAFLMLPSVYAASIAADLARIICLLQTLIKSVDNFRESL